MWGCGGGTSEQVCGVVGVGPGGWWARCSLFALQKLQRVVPSVSGDGRVLLLFERRMQMRHFLPSEEKVRPGYSLLAGVTFFCVFCRFCLTVMCHLH